MMVNVSTYLKQGKLFKANFNGTKDIKMLITSRYVYEKVLHSIQKHVTTKCEQNCRLFCERGKFIATHLITMQN